MAGSPIPDPVRQKEEQVLALRGVAQACWRALENVKQFSEASKLEAQAHFPRWHLSMVGGGAPEKKLWEKSLRMVSVQKRHR